METPENAIGMIVLAACVVLWVRPSLVLLAFGIIELFNTMSRKWHAVRRWRIPRHSVVEIPRPSAQLYRRLKNPR